MKAVHFSWCAAMAAVATALVLTVSPARAQSQVSLALSALPVASVVGTASVSVVPLAFSVAGAALVVKAVEVTASGMVYLLERVSDGTRVSLEVSGRAASAISLGVGTAMVVSVISTGVLLSAAGEVLAFIPNELGRALLHNERITH